MPVLLNRKTLKPTLPDMPVTLIMLMIPSHVAGHPPLHERAERRLGLRLYDEMKVIGHETEAEHVDGKLGLGGNQQLKERRVIAVFVKDRRAAVPAV
jgi:hypothetical protein